MISLLSPQQIKKELNSYPFDDVEATVIRKILLAAGIDNVRNQLINSILDRTPNTGVEFWFETNRVAPDLELLEKLYELDVSGEDRKVNGSYYTPTHIVSYIIESTVKDRGTICDPACGSGAFLVESAKFLKKEYNLSFNEIFQNYIFGTDILPTSVQRTKIILSLLAIVEGEDSDFEFNLYQGDSLSFNWAKVSPNGFDYIVGNPPYVRTKNLRTEVKANIKKWTTANFGNVDLYIPFFELATKISNKNGRIGFITPSTYLTSFNAKLLRAFLSSQKLLEEIVDFNGWQVFEGATTYTCITILDKKRSDSFAFSLVDDKTKLKDLYKIVFHNIKTDTLNENEWRLLPKKEAEKIFKIENAGSPLFKYVDKFVTGLATLNNDLFLVKDSGGKYLKKEYAGQEFLIEKELTKKVIKPNRIKDKKALINNHERIIYPYIYNKTEDKAILMPEEKLSTNFPRAYEYLCAIKNELQLRDKGGKKYAAWYAYGRTQGLNNFGKKVILPMMGNKPTFIAVEDDDNLIYCGYALFPKKEEDLKLLERVLSSEVMWFYLSKTSKNYSGGFKSFAKNYVKNFSIPDFTNDEKEKIIKAENQKEVDEFLWKKYQIA